MNGSNEGDHLKVEIPFLLGESPQIKLTLAEIISIFEVGIFHILYSFKLKMIKTLFAVLIIFLVFGCSNNSKHIGEWKGKNKHISFFIKDDGRIMIVNNNEVMDYRYEIDYTKNPIWLDLLLNEKGEKEVRVKGIIRFITDIKIEFRRQSNPTGQRFDSFDYLDKEHTLVLDKVHK